MNRTLLPLFVLLAMAGCAAKAPAPKAVDLGPGRQSVRIDTPGVFGAACTVQTPKGSHVVLSPASVSLSPGNIPVTVSCSKGEHFRGVTRFAPRKVADGAYLYPAAVSVPMQLNRGSLTTKVRVF